MTVEAGRGPEWPTRWQLSRRSLLLGALGVVIAVEACKHTGSSSSPPNDLGAVNDEDTDTSLANRGTNGGAGAGGGSGGAM